MPVGSNNPLNIGTHNNAPQPIPGFGNPTGTNTGIAKPTGASAGAPPIPFTGTPPPSYNSGVYTATDIQHLSSGGGTAGVGPDNQYVGNFVRELQDAYGKGTGSLLSTLFGKGLFNPQVAAALLNALQPGIQRGQADILNAFGQEGARFGSSAAIGLGDFNSQVQLNEQATLANLYQQDLSLELDLLNNILPTLNKEQDNRGSSGILGDILGGLETAAGVIGAPFTGGATIPLIGAGIGTIAGSNGQSGGGRGGYQPSQSTPPFFPKGTASASNIPLNSSTAVGSPNYDPSFLLDATAGVGLGGVDPYGSSGDSGSQIDPYLLQLLQSLGAGRG